MSYETKLDALVAKDFGNAQVWAADVRFCIAREADATTAELRALLREALPAVERARAVDHNYQLHTRRDETDALLARIAAALKDTP